MTAIHLLAAFNLVLFSSGSTGRAKAVLHDFGRLLERFAEPRPPMRILSFLLLDHIGGLMTEGAPTFANARYVTGQAEFDHWAGAGNDGFEANVRPLADQMTFLGDGDDVVSGVTGMAAFGHTPGHMVYRLDSEGQGLVIFADLANHPVWSLARPDWEVRFDADKAMAAESRRRVLGMIAADRIPAIGYHMPFPATGYVDTREDGFRWVPEAGQLMG